MAQIDRAISVKKRPTPGVDFIKVGCKAQIIEIAPSICALRLRPTFEKLFTGVNVRRRVRKIGAGCKTVYEIDPCSSFSFFIPPPWSEPFSYFSTWIESKPIAWDSSCCITDNFD